MIIAIYLTWHNHNRRHFALYICSLFQDAIFFQSLSQLVNKHNNGNSDFVLFVHFKNLVRHSVIDKRYITLVSTTFFKELSEIISFSFFNRRISDKWFATNNTCTVVGSRIAHEHNSMHSIFSSLRNSYFVTFGIGPNSNERSTLSGFADYRLNFIAPLSSLFICFFLLCRSPKDTEHNCE